MEQAPTAVEQERMPSPKAPLNEHAAYFDAHPEEIRPEYLNNLYLWVPGSEYLAMVGKYLKPNALRRADAVAQELEAQPDVAAAVETYRKEMLHIEDELVQIGKTMQQEEAKMLGASDEMKRAQFRAMEPLRIRETELKRLKEQPQRLNEALIPLYLALRKKGFSHRDLVG